MLSSSRVYNQELTDDLSKRSAHCTCTSILAAGNKEQPPKRASMCLSWDFMGATFLLGDTLCVWKKEIWLIVPCLPWRAA